MTGLPQVNGCVLLTDLVSQSFCGHRLENKKTGMDLDHHKTIPLCRDLLAMRDIFQLDGSTKSLSAIQNDITVIWQLVSN